MSRLIPAARIGAIPVRIEDLPPAGQPFEPEFQPPSRQECEQPVLPRNWLAVEALVAERLRSFEVRHEAECKEAFEQGVQEGERRREADTVRRLEAGREPWQKLTGAVKSQLETYRLELYEAAAHLAAGLGTAWFRQIVSLNPVAFRVALEDALEPLSHQEQIEVRIHPTDHAALADAMADGAEFLDTLKDVKLTTDSAIAPGGVVAHSSGGTVDARIETRLARALDQLHLNGYEHRSTGTD